MCPRSWGLMMVAASYPVLAAAQDRNVTDTGRLEGGIPGGLPLPCVVLIACFGSMVVVLVACGLLKLAQGRGRLVELLPSVCGAALMVVGIAAWGMTYDGAQGQILDKTEYLLRHATLRASENLVSMLSANVELLQVVQGAFRLEQLTHLLQPFPHGPVGVIWPWVSRSVHTAHATGVFFAGHEHGDPSQPIECVGCQINGGANPRETWAWQGDMEVFVMRYGGDAGDFPDFVACNAVDRANNDSTLCADYARQCGANHSMDFMCQATCAGASYSYDRGGVLPSSSPTLCGSVVPAPSVNASLNKLWMMPAAFDVSNGTFHAASAVAQAPSGYAFDPTQRPWWHTDSTPRFTDPYVYAGALHTTGITVSAAVRDAKGMFRGVLGVDFSIADAVKVLNDALPSPRSMFVVVDGVWRVITTSLDQDALSADTGLPPTTLVDYSSIARSGSNIRRAIKAVKDRSGERAFVSAHPMIVVEENDVVLHVPVVVPGLGRQAANYVLILSLPRTDVMAGADEVSVLSLVFTIVVSILCSAMLFAVIRLLLRPLDELAGRMTNVADMQFEDAPPAQSWVLEVAGMQNSFDMMAVKLREYRGYLPPSLFAAGEDGEAEDEDDLEFSEADEPVGFEEMLISDNSSIISSAPQCSSGIIPCSPELPLATSMESSAPSDFRRAESASIKSSAAADRSVVDDVCAATVAMVRLDEETHDDVVSPPPTTPSFARPSLQHSESVFNVCLHEKRVTDVAIHVRDLHRKVLAKNAAALSQHTALLQQALDHAKRTKGIVDSFCGDTISIAFNVHKNSGNHKTNALSCALNLLAAHGEHPDALKLTAGVISGRAMVGTMGCATMKKLNIVGEGVRYAHLLAQAAGEWGVKIAASETVLREARVHYETRMLYRVTYVRSVSEQVRYDTISEVLYARVHANDEWMYEMERAAQSPYRRLDLALELIFNGEYEAALSSLSEEGRADPSAVTHYKKVLKAWTADLQRNKAARPEPLCLAIPRPEGALRMYAADPSGGSQWGSMGPLTANSRGSMLSEASTTGRSTLALPLPAPGARSIASPSPRGRPNSVYRDRALRTAASMQHVPSTPRAAQVHRTPQSGPLSLGPGGISPLMSVRQEAETSQPQISPHTTSLAPDSGRLLAVESFRTQGSGSDCASSDGTLGAKQHI